MIRERKPLAVDGGAAVPITLVPAPNPYGADWGPSNVWTVQTPDGTTLGEVFKESRTRERRTPGRVKLADITNDSGWCGPDLADLIGEWDGGDGWTLRITSDTVQCLRVQVIARKGSRATRDLKCVVAVKLSRSDVATFDAAARWARR